MIYSKSLRPFPSLSKIFDWTGKYLEKVTIAPLRISWDKARDDLRDFSTPASDSRCHQMVAHMASLSDLSRLRTLDIQISDVTHLHAILARTCNNLRDLTFLVKEVDGGSVTKQCQTLDESKFPEMPMVAKISGQIPTYGLSLLALVVKRCPAVQELSLNLGPTFDFRTAAADAVKTLQASSISTLRLAPEKLLFESYDMSREYPGILEMLGGPEGAFSKLEELSLSDVRSVRLFSSVRTDAH